MLYVWLVIFFSNFPDYSLSFRSTFGQHLKNYELAECIVVYEREMRFKRTTNARDKPAFNAEVHFKSFQKDFYLLLSEDAQFRNVKVESERDGNIKSEKIKSKVYEGILKTDASDSYVLGYLEDDAFNGYITNSKDVFFTESAIRFFPNLTQRNKIVVYREQDIDMSRNLPVGKAEKLVNRIFGIGLENELPKGINKSLNGSGDYACSVELVSDHALYEYFKKNVHRLTVYLYLHGKFADFVFRRTDFDGDGKRDRIRIVTEKIHIYKSKNETGYTMAESKDMSSSLKQFSYRIQRYCLSLCMTYTSSKDRIIGEAYKSSASRDAPPGGICQKPVSFYENFSFVRRSLNTAVVTIQNSHNGALPLAVTLLAVAHEFGHGFGSSHDDLANLSCSPGGIKGFHIMHPRSRPELKPLSTFFSPCSRESIARVISARGECLQPHPATCGNSIQEGDEDCDCGKEDICWYIDQCCTPSDAKPPEVGCTFRKAKGSECSPKENLCCLRDCKINRDTKHLCTDNEDESCSISYCDGEKATCPQPTPAPDKHPCLRRSKSCSKGICNSSICLDNGLNDCACSGRFECTVCCQNENSCVTASSLGDLSSTGEYYVAEGTLCNYKRHQCDGSGNCVNPRTRHIESAETPISIWWVVGGLTFLLLTATAILVYFIKEKGIRLW